MEHLLYKILILAEDAVIASALSAQILKELDVSVDISHQMPASKDHGAQLILVDLVKSSPLNTLWSPKQLGDPTPTLVLGEGSSSDSMITFIRKPVRIAYLMGYLHSLLRESTEKKSVLGRLRFSRDMHSLTDPQQGVNLHLSHKETEILNTLIGAMPGFVSRHCLLRTIWGYEADIQTHTLETHIHRLRCKLANIKGIKLITTHASHYALKLTTEDS